VDPAVGVLIIPWKKIYPEVVIVGLGGIFSALDDVMGNAGVTSRTLLG
jgi:hypothetical protein